MSRVPCVLSLSGVFHKCDEEYCEYCVETCHCPCFGGHEYRHTKKLLTESENWVQNIEKFVMRRRRGRSRKAFNDRARRAGAAHFGRAYSSDEEGDGPPKEKRRAVEDSAEPGPAERPPIAAPPAAPAPVPGVSVVPKAKPPAPPVVHLPDQDNDADQDAFNAELEAINARMQNLALDRVRDRVKQRAAPKARNEDRPKCGYPNLTPPHRPCRRSKAPGLKYCAEQCAIFLENGGYENDLRL